MSRAFRDEREIVIDLESIIDEDVQEVSVVQGKEKIIIINSDKVSAKDTNASEMGCRLQHAPKIHPLYPIPSNADGGR